MQQKYFYSENNSFVIEKKHLEQNVYKTQHIINIYDVKFFLCDEKIFLYEAKIFLFDAKKFVKHAENIFATRKNICTLCTSCKK